MDAYASAADLARMYRVSPATIRSWAHRDGWRRTRYRPIRYLLADAQASYDRRHGRTSLALPLTSCNDALHMVTRGVHAARPSPGCCHEALRLRLGYPGLRPHLLPSVPVAMGRAHRLPLQALHVLVSPWPLAKSRDAAAAPGARPEPASCVHRRSAGCAAMTVPTVWITSCRGRYA